MFFGLMGLEMGLEMGWDEDLDDLLGVGYGFSSSQLCEMGGARYWVRAEGGIT